MKLTYWYIQHLTDNNVYSIREKTKRAAIAMAKSHWDQADFNLADVKKVTVEYSDAFDLMLLCSDEGRNYWEYTP